jgi:hypothetical protein
MHNPDELEARDRPLHQALSEAFDQYRNASEAEGPEAKRRYLEALRQLAVVTSVKGEQFMP